MRFTTEAKVGAIFLAGLILLGGMVVTLGKITFHEESYPLDVLFREVNGLTPGNLVRYAGLEIGRVDQVNLDQQGIRVKLKIKKNVQVPAGCHFTITTDGLLGEKYIAVSPAAEFTGYLSPGDEVWGEVSPSMEKLMVSADKVLADIHALMLNLNDIIGDEKVKEALKESALNARLITENLNQLTASLARMAVNNEQDVNIMVDNLRAMSESLRSVAGRVDRLVAAVDNNGQSAADLQATLANIRQASDRIEKMASALAKVVTDPKTAQNLQETLQNVHDASAKANQMISKIGGIKTSGQYEALYGLGDSNFRINSAVRLQQENGSFVQIGGNNLGDNSTYDFHLGQVDGNITRRFGITNSKPGVGLDSQVNDKTQLSMDVYDPNHPKVKLRAEYSLGSDTTLVGQTDSLNQNAENNTYFGIKKSF